MSEQRLKKIIRQWFDSPEGQANCGSLDIKNAPNLAKILQNDPAASRLWELALDLCQKDFRKDHGIYFTPKVMVKALIERLFDLWLAKHPDPEELINIKILDPSCGNGEFLLAALNKLIMLRRRFDKSLTEQQIASAIIKNNLFGIDCNRNVLDLLIKNLEDISGESIDHKHFINANTLDYRSSDECFDNIGKFDIIVGNPPYVSFGLRNVNKIDKVYQQTLRQRFPDSAEYKISIYALFMEFAVNSLKSDGLHSFIVPDSFLAGQYFSKLRNFLLKNSTIHQFWFVRSKVFKAVPGSLVVYFLSAKKAPDDHQVIVSKVDDITRLPAKDGYLMQQKSFEQNHRQRFRIFFDCKTHELVSDLEQKSVCKLNDILIFASGIIGKNGKKSIVSTVKKSSGCWKKGITSGKFVRAGQPVKWHGEYVNVDPKAVKSGLNKIDYNSDKILIRQTGDAVTAAVDYHKLVVLNNIHAAVSKDPSLDLEKIAEYLNSPLLREYYQAVTLESGRALAQIDLETLRELPVLPSAIRKKS